MLEGNYPSDPTGWPKTSKRDQKVTFRASSQLTEEEKRGALYCRYHRRSDHHTMDCYALRNIFHENVAKVILVIKNGKCTDQRMRRLEVATTFFIGYDDPMKEEVENMASSNVAPTPLQDEEMML